MKGSTGFHLILRYQIDPAWESEARIDEIVAYCEEAGIGEIMLLLLAEELSTGHPTDAEWEEWIGLACRLRDRLAARGLTLSLNPWTTTYQVPRGRTLRKGQRFRLMVGETGKENDVTACPLCPEWQRYLCESFSKLAREVRPMAIWVEDDWRLHNHGPELGWGGCFCEAHLERFSKATGQTVTRQELVKAILQPGTPHPWRARWFDLSRETLLEPMEALRGAVHDANPDCQLGLMSSRPDQHSVEGRCWSALGRAVSGERPFLLRPHMEPYTEERAFRTTASVTRHTLACLSGPVAIYPELENSPRCGIYSKSARHTVWQMLEAAVLGAPGITINHFDNVGSGTSLDPKLGAHLRAAKPFLDALVPLGIDDRNAQGVQILFSPEVASHLHLPEIAGNSSGGIDAEALSRQMQLNPSGAGGAGFAGSMQSLVHPSLVWAETCAILGIAHRFTQTIEPGRGPILINGQTLRAFNDEAVLQLLSGFCVLDAAATRLLQERGFGNRLGVRVGAARKVEEGPFAYEQFFEENPACFGVASPRLTAQRIAGTFHELQPAGGAVVRAGLFSPGRKFLSPSTVDYANPAGGRVITLAYSMDGGAQFFMAYFNTFRRMFWQNLFLEDPRGGGLVMGPDGTRLYRHRIAGGTLVSVLNPTLDAIDGVILRCSDFGDVQGAWKLLGSNGLWSDLQISMQNGTLRLPVAIPHLRGVCLWNQDRATSNSS